MRGVELGRAGEPVSQVGLGCMLMGTTMEEPTSLAMLDRSAEAVGTLPDTEGYLAALADRR